MSDPLTIVKVEISRERGRRIGISLPGARRGLPAHPARPGRIRVRAGSGSGRSDGASRESAPRDSRGSVEAAEPPEEWNPPRARGGWPVPRGRDSWGPEVLKRTKTRDQSARASPAIG